MTTDPAPEHHSPDNAAGWLWQPPLEDDDLFFEAEHTTPTSMPCPPWCDLPAGHHFETTGAGLLRVHRQRYGDKPTHVALETMERAVDPAGPTDLGIDGAATLVRVQFPHASGYLSPSGARRLAHLLHQAADTADKAAAGGEQ